RLIFAIAGKSAVGRLRRTWSSASRCPVRTKEKLTPRGRHEAELVDVVDDAHPPGSRRAGRVLAKQTRCSHNRGSRPEDGSAPVLTSSNPISTLLQRFACARLSQPCLSESCSDSQYLISVTRYSIKPLFNRAFY